MNKTTKLQEKLNKTMKHRDMKAKKAKAIFGQVIKHDDFPFGKAIKNVRS